MRPDHAPAGRPGGQYGAPGRVQAPPPSAPALVDAIDAVLPQTQCTRCGYPDCRAYAGAIASGQAAINQCPPGGAEGVRRLATITGEAPRPLDPQCGTEAPRALAVIDEAWCIGCTLCLKACPVDAIVGANKTMHAVLEEACTGCELCLPVCPVDCITLEPASGEATGWAAWSRPQATQARTRYERRAKRLGLAIGAAQAPLHQRRTPVPRAPAASGEGQENTPSPQTDAVAPAAPTDKAQLLAAIMAKARARRDS